MRVQPVLTLFAIAAAVGPACQCGRLEIGPANRIAAGNYQSLMGFPWGDDQKYVITQKVDADGRATGAFTVFRVKEGDACDVPVRSPQYFWSVGDTLLVFEDIDWDRWTGRLSEVQLPCGPARPIFDDVYLSWWRDPADAFLYLFVELDHETRRGRIVKLYTPSLHVEEAVANVSSEGFDFDPGTQRFFYREDGKLVVRNFRGRVEARIGSGVTSYVPSGTGLVLYEEHPKLSLATADGLEDVPLSDDACYPSFADQRLFYMEPCDPPHAIVERDRQTRAVLGRFGTDVGSVHTWPEGWLSWIDKPRADGSGELWVRPPGKEPFLVAPHASPEWHIADKDGFILHAVMTGARTADLVTYQLADGTRRVLASGVDPAIAVAESPWSPHYAVVQSLVQPNAPDGGTLDRLGGLAIVHPKTAESVPVAADVPVRGFRFSWQAPAIGYLHGWDPAARAGSLEVMSLLDQKKYPVDALVREFAEVYAPRRGVVYIVRDLGERSGLYFVEANVALF